MVGNATYVTDPRGTGANDPNYTTTTAYDARDRKSTVTDPQGHVTTFGYDPASNITSITRPDGSTEYKSYDELNRVTMDKIPREGPPSAPTVFIYNYFYYYGPATAQMCGQLQKFTDGENKSTFFKYEAAGMKTRLIYPDNADPNNPTDYQEWVYDFNHNVTSRRTANSVTQNFTYDERNRKRTMTWSNQLDYANFKYDAAGRLANADNANSLITRAYDAAGELTLDRQNVTGLGSKDVQYQYTTTRQTRLYITGAAYDYTFSYDAMGRFEKILPTGSSVSFQYYYDAASNEVERYDYLNSVGQFYTRDNLNRMSRRDLKLNTSVISSEAYGYDSMSRLITTDREDGKRDAFSYYLDGELWTANYAQPTPTPTATPTPPPNQCAPVTFSTTGGGSTNLKVYMSTATTGATIFYTMGNADYVTPTHNGSTPTGTTHVYTGSVTVARGAEKFFEAVAYKSGMTDSVFTEFDADNTGGGGGQAPIRLSASSSSSPRSVTYYLDKAGNRTSIVDTGNTTTYTPNILNQYTGVGGTNNVGNGSEHELNSYQGISYTYVNDERLASIVSGTNNYQLLYDALGRCVKRTLNNVTTYYVYDGEKPILQYNSAGAVTAKNLYGKSIDEILMRTDLTVTPNRTLYYQDDHEGSVTHLTDATGAVVEHYHYDVFGAPSIEDANGNSLTASAFGNRFIFTGREYVATFGVYEYRNRAYHPGLGRFMSEDPKLFGAGDNNFFRYVGNDPLDRVDPMGTEETSEWLQQYHEEVQKDGQQQQTIAVGPKTYWGIKNDRTNQVRLDPTGKGLVRDQAMEGNTPVMERVVPSAAPLLHRSQGLDRAANDIKLLANLNYRARAESTIRFGDTIAKGAGWYAVAGVGGMAAGEVAPELAPLRVDGPKFGKSGGRIIGIRYGPVNIIRLDYHPLSASDRTPMLHLNVGPSETHVVIDPRAWSSDDSP